MNTYEQPCNKNKKVNFDIIPYYVTFPSFFISPLHLQNFFIIIIIPHKDKSKVSLKVY
jgi:hypothetical protein